MRDSGRAIIYATIAILSWSTVATAFKIALRNYSAYEMLTVSSLVALCIFTIAITVQKKWGLLKKLKPKQWGGFTLIGLLNPVIYYLVLFKAYDLLPAQIAQPINYFWPIILTILLAIYTRKAIPKLKYLGMLISLGGVVLISTAAKDIDGSALALSGLLLALLSGFIWALFWILNNLNKETDNMVLLFLGFFFGSIYLLLGTIFVDVDFNSLHGLVASIYIGVFEMGIPFIFFGMALRLTNNPALVNQMCYLAPFISLFIIHLVLGEHIYTATYLGLFMIVLGIVFNEYIAGYILSLKKRKGA